MDATEIIIMCVAFLWFVKDIMGIVGLNYNDPKKIAEIAAIILLILTMSQYKYKASTADFVV